MDVFYLLGRQFSYFVIAFSVYLLGKSIYYFAIQPITVTLFDAFLSFSLLCSNVPRVLPISPRLAYYLAKLDFLFLTLAIIMFALLFIL